MAFYNNKQKLTICSDEQMTNNKEFSNNDKGAAHSHSNSEGARNKSRLGQD